MAGLIEQAKLFETKVRIGNFNTTYKLQSKDYFSNLT